MIDPLTSALLTDAAAQILAREKDYTLYTDYYAGRQRIRYATEKYRNAFAYLFTAMSLNLSKGVVNAPADRLEMIGFSTQKGTAALADKAWEIWQDNRMDIRAGVVHKAALLYGNAYAIIWPDKTGRPVIHPNTSDGIVVAYDAETPGLIASAVKMWAIPSADPGSKAFKVRATVYLPDRIEKYISAAAMNGIPAGLSGAAFEEYRDDPADGGKWPLPNPWGVVPVFHFANDADSSLGYSELQDIIPLQDALNKSVYDMMVAMEFSAFAQRWAVGLEVEIDEVTGRPVQPFEPGVDRVWAVANESVKFGEFSRADLKQFLEVKQDFKLDIAQVSATPLHYLALIKDPPSGEALKTLEARFVKKVRDRQASFGAQWEALMALALRMAKLAGPNVRLTARWQDAATKSEKMEWETLILKQTVGVDTATLLEEGGYGKADAQLMAAARQQQVADQLALQKADPEETKLMNKTLSLEK